MCPYCGSTELNSDFNYDIADVIYECKDCGKEFRDCDCQYCDGCGEQINPNEEKIECDGMVYCSNECQENNQVIKCPNCGSYNAHSCADKDVEDKVYVCKDCQHEFCEYGGEDVQKVANNLDSFLTDKSY